MNEAVAELEPPPAQSAVAVGGTAHLRRLMGGELVPDALEGGLALLARTPIAEVARRFELDAERAAAAGRYRRAPGDVRAAFMPLRLARGGLRRASCSSSWRAAGLRSLSGSAPAAIRRSSLGRRSTLSSAPSCRPAHTSSSSLARRSGVDRGREVRLVAHQQHVAAQPVGQALGVEGPAASSSSRRGSRGRGSRGEPRGGIRRLQLGGEAGVDLHARPASARPATRACSPRSVSRSVGVGDPSWALRAAARSLEGR